MPKQGVLVHRTYPGYLGPIVEFGIRVGEKVYLPQVTAFDPEGVSDAKKGWHELSAVVRENYRAWEGKSGKWGRRASTLAFIERNWDGLIYKGQQAEAKHKEDMERYETLMKELAKARASYSLPVSALAPDMAIEDVARREALVITEITPEGEVYARPALIPGQAGGFLGKDVIKGYRLLNPTLAIPIKSWKQQVHLFDAERHLHKAGVHFDTGVKLTKPMERHWELDWSLRGATLKNPAVLDATWQNRFFQLFAESIAWKEPSIRVEYIGESPTSIHLRLSSDSTYPLDRLAGKYQRRLKDNLVVERTGDSGRRRFIISKDWARRALAGYEQKHSQPNPTLATRLSLQEKRKIEKDLFGVSKQVRKEAFDNGYYI